MRAPTRSSRGDLGGGASEAQRPLPALLAQARELEMSAVMTSVEADRRSYARALEVHSWRA